MVIVICGGAGFIGSNLLQLFIERGENQLIVIDRLSYASHPKAVAFIRNSEGVDFHIRDIGDRDFIHTILRQKRPDVLINLAAETHVDNSINAPEIFIENNINSTFRLLQECLRYWHECAIPEQKNFRFVHISTDEVYGSIDEGEEAAREDSAYRPTNPYSATKAAADHMISSFQNTYGFPANILYFSNNYGPYQHSEKLIPKTIENAIASQPIPIYGDGSQKRTWINVKDSCEAVLNVIEKGNSGSNYNFAGQDELQNLDLVIQVCTILDDLRPLSSAQSYRSLITFVEDRPGHDTRYAINSGKAISELEWTTKISFQRGLVETVDWYLEQHKMSLSCRQMDK